MERKKLGKGKSDLITKDHSEANEKKPKEKLSLIVKVNKPGYVPDGFDVRTRINDYLFTADSTPSIVQLHEHDDNVVSISKSERSQMID